MEKHLFTGRLQGYDFLQFEHDASAQDMIPCSYDTNSAKDMGFEYNGSTYSKCKTIRRTTSPDKELDELVHKTHSMCLLSRGRIVNSTSGDHRTQEALLSLLPTYLLKIPEVPKLTAKDLGRTDRWFHDNFHGTKTSNSERPFTLKMAETVENCKETSKEISALALNVTNYKRPGKCSDVSYEESRGG